MLNYVKNPSRTMIYMDAWDLDPLSAFYFKARHLDQISFVLADVHVESIPAAKVPPVNYVSFWNPDY